MQAIERRTLGYMIITIAVRTGTTKNETAGKPEAR